MHSYMNTQLLLPFEFFPAKRARISGIIFVYGHVLRQITTLAESKSCISKGMTKLINSNRTTLKYKIP